MRRQDFDRLRLELLPLLESLTVLEHATLHRDLRGESWAPPNAYRFIRYEDPEPVTRLAAASQRLRADWAAERDRPGWTAARARFEVAEANLLDQAEAIARRLGYA
ncbi:MAG: hypothetical protein M3024_01820 [Candidatus Dormibacteraeota bacterium]|nr:hypothetical protein [Candidatus Dormibacteraeota bacterium]